MSYEADLATEVQLIGEHLLQLLARPDEPSGETLELCLRLFGTAGEPVLARWIECELSGYGQSGAVSLREILGVAENAPLASRVRGYRQHVGRVRTAHAGAVSGARPLQVPYFFGETLETLRHLRTNADSIGLDFLEVELVSAASLADPESAPSGAPSRSLEFPRYVFYRILSGLTVEMEVSVRGILQRFSPHRAP